MRGCDWGSSPVAQRPLARKPPAEDPNAQHIARLAGARAGRDAFVVGTGTSLAGFDWAGLNGLFTIALNDAGAVDGFEPDFHLFSDPLWHRYEKRVIARNTKVVCVRESRRRLLKSKDCVWKEQVWQFNTAGKAKGLVHSASTLYVNRTVATGGITLAWRLGARRVFLLGIDGYKLRRKDGREVYYHDGRAKVEKRREIKQEGERVTQDRHRYWGEDMAELRAWFAAGGLYPCKWPGPGVYNLSARSTIDAWPKVDAAEVLEAVKKGGTVHGDLF